MEQPDSIRPQPSVLRRLWDDFILLCAAMDLSDGELVRLRLSRLADEVADMQSAALRRTDN